MRFQLVALALAVAVHATPETSESIENISSVIATALPSSLRALAATNPAAFVGAISSEFASSQTPSWFAALPSDVQTFIIPVATTSASSAHSSGTTSASSAHSSGTTSASSAHSTGLVGTAPIGNMTVAGTGSASVSGTAKLTTMTSSSTTSTVGVVSHTTTTGSASSSSSGGASMPTAVLGLGFAGVAGLVGVLAL